MAFSDQMNKLAEDFVIEAEKVIKEVVFRNMEEIVDGTPKDTGNLMANWDLAKDTTGERDPISIKSPIERGVAKTKSMNRITKGLSEYKVGDEQITIFNNVRYAEYVEEGNNNQRNSGWVSRQAIVMEKELVHALNKLVNKLYAFSRRR